MSRSWDFAQAGSTAPDPSPMSVWAAFYCVMRITLDGESLHLSVFRLVLASKHEDKTMNRIRAVALLLPIMGWSVWALAQKTGTRLLPVSLNVSVETRHGGAVPEILREDVRVLQGKNRLTVTDWVPLQREQGELQLFVLMDESLASDIGIQFEDLRHFMMNEPATTAIALGYMQHGTAEVVQTFTKDHSLVAKALRLPMGASGISPSPYLSVSDVINHWPETTARREILMVSNGVDQLNGGPSNPYLATAIEQAQRSGIQIYGIYASAAGHFGHSFWQVNWGQNDMAQMAEETGGEFYVQGTRTPIAFKPYLAEFQERLRHQYKLTFLMPPDSKPGYQRINLETEVPNAELVAAPMVYVPAAK
jgi:hypothetical protein